ncbi:MAG: alcohol dehydrogenase catalytic domain-containing protein [Acidobacteriota bacterium]|jgi:threonine dehydrogenase-like Zn-dependent dehydrogenase
MIGLWLQNGELSLRSDLPRPEPAPGEALVRVLLAGICNTDLELVRGYYPYEGILGHEFVGVVEKAPAGHAHLEGRRVVGEINAVCGDCPECDAGRSNHCEKRTVLGIVDRDGAFAEYLTLPVGNLHQVPDKLPNEAAVFTEPLAAALRVGKQVDLAESERVLVVGDGKLGQLVARVLRLSAPYLCVAGRHFHKLALLGNLGIDTVAVDDESEVTPARTLRRFDVAVECTGNAEGFELARRALRPRGTLVMKSTYAGDLTFDASGLVVDEITLVGSRCGPFAPALELLTSGAVQVEELIADRYPLSAGLAAFEHARRRGTLKVLLQVA